MIRIAELLDGNPTILWSLLPQLGVVDIVSLLEHGEQKMRWLRRESQTIAEADVGEIPSPGERSWERPALERLVARYAEAGLRVAVLEDTPPMDAIRLDHPDRDEQIEWFQTQLQAMGEVGIPTLCYNWMAISSWARTGVAIPARGGALVTGYDDTVMQQAPPLSEPGEITETMLWENLEYFLQAVVPVAEQAGVQLGLHPDDPPLSRVRGVPRIMRSLTAYQRAIDLVASHANAMTFCQGNIALMTDDLPAAIRHFGRQGKIVFVHFRDVRGTPRRFVETFHDDGPTDLLECLRAYRDVGFSGVLRPDHVPALAGENNEQPGYTALARLHAIGYITGLREAAYGSKSAAGGRVSHSPATHAAQRAAQAADPD